MNDQRKFGAFTSSTNPEEFSKTIASALRIIGSVVAGVAALKGITITVNDAEIEQVANAFTVIATSAIAIWHSGEFLFGLVRKWTNRG